MGIESKICHIYLLILILSLEIHLSVASNAISTGQSLTGNQTITSEGGMYELGFFKPGNSLNYYLGIWYKQVSVQTLVWVANRDKPFFNTSSELTLSEDGNLLLSNQFNNPIWSTNSSSSLLNTTVAVLLDNGNFVLRNVSNSSSIIWQSFYYPTDTLLFNGRVGRNKITGEVQLLSSWTNLENPSPGMFTLEIDPEGSSQYYLVWNKSQRYWTSGLWNGQTFANIPELTTKYFSDIEFVSNERETYFTYSYQDTSLISRFVLDISGQIRQYKWLNNSQEWVLMWSRPNNPCDAFSVCGSFGNCSTKFSPICRCLHGFEPSSPKDWNLSDWSGGCVRKTPLRCGDKRQGDRFQMMPNMQWPTNFQKYKVQSIKECQSACLTNCSCSAYSYIVECLIWGGGLRNLKELSAGDVNGGDIFIRLAASELPQTTNSKKIFNLAILAVGVVGLGLFGIIVVRIWRCRERRFIAPSWAARVPSGPFKYRELQIATKNFSEKLGAGSFGSVFKGTLSDSTPVAVKMLEGSRQGEKEFRAEVITIGRIQHVNLVRLRGFCSESAKRLLVYDHMPNGSLDKHLFRKDSQLEWKVRYQVALGIAKGLSYLHEKCRECIIHCDIKPENILLDVDFCPKVADFGLSKLFGRHFSRVLTTMRGTRGYLAPEWISGLPITSKADVYSYGMMLLEIVSGRRNLDQPKDGNFEFFPICVARRLHNGEEILSLLDYKLEGDADLEELKRACIVACWCIQDDEKNRPSMGHIVQFLEGIYELSTPPIPLDLQCLVDNLGYQETSGSSSQIYSNT
ncbi:hypothetical protein GIB67_021755 [Kingdonia uniflora]|uniref:Receptor-like serine/threonine-protein kinase n=1 Tax=Kingdonia uniflora TaxID=39325 RepID=A0A7J7M9K4_9MAGN|nr:hypothetical protein GIB67_021755 [Kingdonia uniflora]